MKRILVFACVLSSMGCIRAPEIVMVDRATALEQQASGSFDDLERKLGRTSIEPRPVPLTPKQFEALGINPMPYANPAELTEADRLDALLLQHCIGEGRDALLAETHEACVGAVDRAEALDLMERVNQARLQLWRWMHGVRTDASENDLRRTWREIHLRGVPCGAWIEGEPGKWAAKQC